MTAMLFTPVKIGSMELKNRIIYAPMGVNFDAPDHNVSQRSIDYYAARARGGVAAITVGVVAVDPIGRGGRAVPGLWDDSFIPGWRRLAEAVHSGGARLIPQLHHAGRQTSPKTVGGQIVSSSPIPCPVCKSLPRELTIEEIEGLVEKFGQAACRACEAGCDAVELHGAHGYLIAQFLSAYANKRTDAYGGTLEGRLRFALEVVKRIKKEAGQDFPVIFRLSGEEMVPGGLTIGETTVCAALLARGGVDGFHVSRGVLETLQWTVPPQGTPIALNVPLAEAIKKSAAVPVIAVGRIPDPLVAEQVLQSGKADIIALGRPLIADPEWPKKVAAGDLEGIRPCLYCNQCLNRALRGQPIACTMNAAAGNESVMDIVAAPIKKKVLVAGGGPAGMEAARVAAARGHQVLLYEKASRLGGQLNIAAIPPAKQEIAKAVRYFSTQMKRAGVSIEFGKEVTPSVVDDLKPDVMIVATGGRLRLPDIPGVAGGRVVSAHDVLAGKVELYHFDAKLRAVVGNRILIIGGGMVGAETADYARERGAGEIYILEMLPEIALDMPFMNRLFLMERLAPRVKVFTSATVKQILENAVVFVRDGKEETIGNLDNIVLATGMSPVNELARLVKDRVAEVHVIGDAREPRKALDAIAEGAGVGLKI